MENFIDTYRIKPKILYIVLCICGVPKAEVIRAINLLWDDCDHSSDFELLQKSEQAYEWRKNRWKERERLFLNRG